MYTVEILHPTTCEVIEVKTFNSRYEAELYGQEYQYFCERFNKNN